MGDEMDEAVRRFIHLVDALYDHGVKLIVTAAAAPDLLYTGTRLRQAFRRTASRLTEMSAKVYLARPHRAD
jgi:cell division protein ZapE